MLLAEHVLSSKSSTDANANGLAKSAATLMRPGFVLGVTGAGTGVMLAGFTTNCATLRVASVDAAVVLVWLLVAE
jgi:hypothetical protein